jgi:hypothetical protein
MLAGRYPTTRKIVAFVWCLACITAALAASADQRPVAEAYAPIKKLVCTDCQASFAQTLQNAFKPPERGFVFSYSWMPICRQGQGHWTVVDFDKGVISEIDMNRCSGKSGNAASIRRDDHKMSVRDQRALIAIANRFWRSPKPYTPKQWSTDADWVLSLIDNGLLRHERGPGVADGIALELRSKVERVWGRSEKL